MLILTCLLVDEPNNLGFFFLRFSSFTYFNNVAASDVSNIEFVSGISMLFLEHIMQLLVTGIYLYLKFYL